MPTVYLHNFGNESVDELLRSQGYLPPKDDNGFDFNPLGIKKCGNCGTRNLPEAISCSKCKMLVDHLALNEIMKEQEEKDAKIAALESSVSSLKKSFEAYVNDIPLIMERLVEGARNVNFNIPYEIIQSMENETKERRTEILNDWLSSSLHQTQINNNIIGKRKRHSKTTSTNK